MKVVPIVEVGGGDLAHQQREASRVGTECRGGLDVVILIEIMMCGPDSRVAELSFLDPTLAVGRIRWWMRVRLREVFGSKFRVTKHQNKSRWRITMIKWLPALNRGRS